MLTNSSILAQPENNAADRQISMIIFITNDKSFIQRVLLNPDNSCSQRCLGVHSDNKSTAEPTHIIFTVCIVFRLKCVSDLSKYCVRKRERSSKRQFPISNYIVCVQSCDGSRGEYII